MTQRLALGRGKRGDGRLPLVARRDGAPPRRGAPAADRLVRYDPQEPRPERLVGPEAAERAVGVNERLLRRVLGLGGIAQHEERHAEGHLLVAAHQRLVGGEIAPCAATISARSSSRAGTAP